MALPGVNAGTYNDTKQDISRVERPPKIGKGTILDLLDDRFSVFKAVLKKAGCAEQLNGTSKRTVFVFPDKYLCDQTKKSLNSLDIGESFALISTHIVTGLQFISEDRLLIPTLNQYNLLHVEDHTVSLDKQTTDILNNGHLCTNGLIIIIHDPLIPQKSYI